MKYEKLSVIIYEQALPSHRRSVVVTSPRRAPIKFPSLEDRVAGNNEVSQSMIYGVAQPRDGD